MGWHRCKSFLFKDIKSGINGYLKAPRRCQNPKKNKDITRTKNFRTKSHWDIKYLVNHLRGKIVNKVINSSLIFTISIQVLVCLRKGNLEFSGLYCLQK